jgi:guanosine-3',5'-bis(diphosphate) 3'-pyrophosphohydrolase
VDAKQGTTVAAPSVTANDRADTGTLLKAVEFAASKHRDQRRKGADASPYVNHPIGVAYLLADSGGVTDLDTLAAAVLHDTLEDTETTTNELDQLFGSAVRRIVEEVTDDKTLEKSVRKELQVDHARSLSPSAKAVKIADKIMNVRDVTDSPPADWDLARRVEYLDWAERVVAGCRGTNIGLEEIFDQELMRGRATLITQ